MHPRRSNPGEYSTRARGNIVLGFGRYTRPVKFIGLIIDFSHEPQ
jgi:hypothetical protein